MKNLAVRVLSVLLISSFAAAATIPSNNVAGERSLLSRYSKFSARHDGGGRGGHNHDGDNGNNNNNDGDNNDDGNNNNDNNGDGNNNDDNSDGDNDNGGNDNGNNGGDVNGDPQSSTSKLWITSTDYN